MNIINLYSLLIIPLIGSLIILLYLVPILALNNNQIKSSITNINNKQTTLASEKIKNIALITTLINFIISIILWIQFDSNYIGYQFVTELPINTSSLGLKIENIDFITIRLGVDGISIYFVLLTTFITPIALLSNYKNIYKNLKYFLISFLLLETLQIALFVVLDLFLFYIFFESVLPVLFIIIIVYGSGVNRIRSALLFFLYTLAGSLFMLLAILQIYSYVGSTDFQLISLNEISLVNKNFNLINLIFLFLDKSKFK